jgi:type II secretory pathway pseudopilin PulG
MVVVAIIGILATIAIPNYTKYRARSHQAEAKNVLSAVFTAQKGFFAEYGTYTANLRWAGFALDGPYDTTNPPWFSPLPGNKARYSLEIATSSACFPCVIDLRPYGFAAWNNGGSDTDPDVWGTLATNCDVTQGSAGPHWVDQMRNGVASGVYPAAITNNTFESVAAGCPAKNILFAIPADWAYADVWSINQDRVLKNQNSGL